MFIVLCFNNFLDKLYSQTACDVSQHETTIREVFLYKQEHFVTSSEKGVLLPNEIYEML